MQSLMKKTGLESRFIAENKLDSLTTEDLVVDYSNNDKREIWFEESKQFLTGAIARYDEDRKCCRK